MARHFVGNRLREVLGDKKWVEKGLWYVEALATRLIWRISERLSPATASEIGAKLGRWIGPRTAKHRHVLTNIGIVLRDRSAAEIEAVALEVWANTGRVVLEFPHLGRLAGTDQSRYIELVDKGGAAAVSSGGPAIYVTAHLGNWNLATLAGSVWGRPMSAIFSVQSNPFLERAMDYYRSRLPAKFVAATESARTIIEELKAGNSVGLVTDQRFDGGEMIDFFGRPAPTAVASARIATTMGIPFIPIRVERMPGCRFRLTIEEPLRPDERIGDKRARARDMIVRLNQLFEG